MSKKKLLYFIHYVSLVEIYNNTACTHPFLSKNSLSGVVTTSISGLSLIESCEEDTLLCCKEDTLFCDVFAIEIDAGVSALINACAEITIANSSNRIDLDAAMSTLLAIAGAT